MRKEKKKIAYVSDIEHGPCYSGQVSECFLYEDGTLGFTSGDFRCWGFYLVDYHFRNYGCTYWLAVENHLRYLQEKDNTYYSKIVSMCMKARKWEFIKSKIQEDHEFVQKYGEPLEFVEIEIPYISPFCSDFRASVKLLGCSVTCVRLIASSCRIKFLDAAEWSRSTTAVGISSGNPSFIRVNRKR